MNESPNAQTEGAIESRKDKIANKFDKSQDVLLSNPDEFPPCSISKKSLERDLENSLEKLLEVRFCEFYVYNSTDLLMRT